MQTILDAEKPENIKVLRRIRVMDLVATKEKIQLRRQGKYFNEPTKQSRRHGIYEDDEGAAGGTCR
jgi:hypothetical protein